MSNSWPCLLQVSSKARSSCAYLCGSVRFLTSSESFDIRRWSSDGLAYLTLDADVKEELADNLPALKALFTLCQSQDAHVLYSLTTIFVNLTNTYEVQKPDKEMEELAAYAKQHIPKEHPKVRRSERPNLVRFAHSRTTKRSTTSDEEKWLKRELFQCWYNYVNIKVKTVENKSLGRTIAVLFPASKFLLCRIFLGLCENEKYRGPIVAGGGAKVTCGLLR
jgi:hypothetical protein